VAGAALIGAGLAAVPSAARALPGPAVAGQAVTVPCSVPALITAITAANAAGTGVLRLAPFCTYTLTAPAVTGTRGPDGLPIITGNVTLVGQHRTTIKRFAAAEFRILEVATGGTLHVESVVIAGGDGGANTGGGILNANGTLSVTGSVISRNTADNGAGISNDRGHLTIVNSIISVNTTGAGGGGGGVYNDGTLTLRHTTLSANYANTNGGGVYNEQGGRTTVISSTFSGNGAEVSGGGIYNNTGSVTALQLSLVYDNSSGADGAGIYNHGTLQLVQSRLTANRATGTGGGTFNAAGGTEAFYSSRVDRNVAASGSGIFNAGALGSVALHSSVVSSNVGGNCRPLGSIPGCLG
jgi:hypothetical protein